MLPGDLDRRRVAIRAAIELYLTGRQAVGLSEVKRHLYNHFSTRDRLCEDGRLIARMLTGLGWIRDGFDGSSYDRCPRYVRRAGA